MNPEILLEQIIGYCIGANEIVPDIHKKIDKDYHFAVLPYGPHFYTGVLQSSGYLLLPEKKNVLFIISQDQKADEIFQITGTFGPVLGKVWTLSTDKQRDTNYQPQIHDLEAIVQHLAFLDVITQATCVSCIAVGEKLSVVNKKKLNTYLKAQQKSTNIVFLTNLSIHHGNKKGRKNDEALLQDILLGADKQSPSLLKLFQSISTQSKREAEVIAYANSWDFWGDKQKSTGYACILA